MEPKLPSESKLVWFAIVQIVMALMGAVPEVYAFILQFTADNPLDWSDLGALVPWLLMLASGIITILLRFVTKQPIVWTKV